MNMNNSIKHPAALDTGAAVKTDKVVTPAQTLATVEYREVWKILRAVLVVWALAVWLLLVMMPGMEQISNMATAMLHLPNMFIGLGLVCAIFAAYNLRSDGHLLWFLGVLLLLAGWM